MGCLVSLTLLTCAAYGPEPLRVCDIQVCQGLVGPVREPVYDLCEEFFARFKIAGAKANTEGYVSIDWCVDLLDPEGNKIDHAAGTAHLPQFYSHEASFHTRIAIPPTWKPGTYLAKVNIKDNDSENQTHFEQKFTVLAAKFAILPIQFFMDPELKIPAANGGFVNQILYCKSCVVGFDKTKGLVDCELGMQILDSNGQKILRKFTPSRSKESDPDKVKKCDSVPIWGCIPLECPGDYLLRSTATDHVTGKTIKLDTPFHISVPVADKKTIRASP